MANKPLSHFERMMTVKAKKPAHYSMPYEVFEDEQVVSDGRVVKKSVIKTVHPSEMFAGLKASDFALENVIAAGAMDMLKPTMLHDGNLDSVDMIDGTLNDIMDQIDAAAQSEVKNNDEE